MAKDRKIDMVILGLLAHEDMTGYDIKKRIDGGISFFWKGSYGSIYPALADMESKGMIEKVKHESSSKREKILYHITKPGYEALVEWLRNNQAVNELKYETLLKLFFGGAADREVSIRNIEIFGEHIKDELETLRLYRDNILKVQDAEDHVYYYLTIMFGIESYEAYLRWCDKAESILRGK